MELKSHLKLNSLSPAVEWRGFRRLEEGTKTLDSTANIRYQFDPISISTPNVSVLLLLLHHSHLLISLRRGLFNFAPSAYLLRRKGPTFLIPTMKEMKLNHFLVKVHPHIKQVLNYRIYLHSEFQEFNWAGDSNAYNSLNLPNQWL